MGSGLDTVVTGADVLRRLGLEALVEILETTAYGVCVTGEDHTWVYLNPAGERLFGRPFAELRGQDYLQHFPEREREVLLALEERQRAGDTDFYTNTVLRPDGTEREMTWSGTVVEVDGAELAPAVFHETTEVRQAHRRAAEVARARHGASGRDHVLESLVDEACRSTRACAGVLLLEADGGHVEVAAASGADPALPGAVADRQALLSDLPATDDLARGRSAFVSDAADRLAAASRTRDWVAMLSPTPWSGAALFPVRCEGDLIGALVVALPADLASPSESELATWSTLADQVGVVLGADRIRDRVAVATAKDERSRIARDLHDSVSQALFSLHARAQVVRRALAADDRALALEAAEHMESVSRRAAGELRSLVTELRPAAEGRDLAGELRAVIEDVRRVDGLAVELCTSPARLPVAASDVAEHVTRVVREALHNVVKHAAASTAAVEVTAGEGRLDVEVRDDGCGFDPHGTADGFGQQTMRERAVLLGGELTVDSAPRQGTTVRLTVPLG